MSKSFVATDPSAHNGKSNTWFTPQWIIESFPEFDLDPCTVSYRPFKTAKREFFHDLGECGLDKAWCGDVWLNPPYGHELEAFVEKFIKHKSGVMLVFARMGNRAIQSTIEAGASFFFLRKRIKFISKDITTQSNAGADSCLIFFDNKYIQYVTNLDGQLLKGGA